MIRSLLYVPASAPRFIVKAHERGADAIILDLEDAVAEQEKTAAREALADAVPAVARGGARVFVRVNAGVERRAADIAAACAAGADGIYLPKVTGPAFLDEVDAELVSAETTSARAPLQVVALVEDPGAVLDARAIARHLRVTGLSLGSEDVATAMGAEPVPEVLRLPKLLVHYAAKAEGKLSFGLFRSVADFADHEAIRAAGQEARRFGFDGASCVHPAVVPLLNEAFAPSAEQIDRARRLVIAAEDAFANGTGAFTFEGEMVDAPIVTRALDLLRRSNTRA